MPTSFLTNEYLQSLVQGEELKKDEEDDEAEVNDNFMQALLGVGAEIIIVVSELREEIDVTQIKHVNG